MGLTRRLSVEGSIEAGAHAGAVEHLKDQVHREFLRAATAKDIVWPSVVIEWRPWDVLDPRNKYRVQGEVAHA